MNRTVIGSLSQVGELTTTWETALKKKRKKYDETVFKKSSQRSRSLTNNK